MDLNLKKRSTSSGSRSICSPSVVCVIDYRRAGTVGARCLGRKSLKHQSKRFYAHKVSTFVHTLYGTILVEDKTKLPGQKEPSVNENLNYEYFRSGIENVALD